jgi:uncharacterized protein (TIGR02001 family)
MRRGKGAILRAARQPKNSFMTQTRAAFGRKSYASTILLLGVVIGAPRGVGADVWGGSVGVTSDYFLRGISKSNDQPALQLDLHYLNASGFVAGLFASNTQIEPSESRDVELSGFLGYVRSLGSDWQGKLLASHYSYPWNHQGSQYNYDEIELQAAYRGWLSISLAYSPNSPRFLYHGLVGVTAEWVELSLQRPVLGKLSGTAGIGYYYFDSEDAAGYAYWSVGVAYDLAPVSLALSYVGTSAEANALFYNAAGGGRWTGTVIWRF